MPANARYVCKCGSELSILALRQAHEEGKSYTCSTCSKSWPVDRLGEIIDAIDIQRFKKKVIESLDDGIVCPCCGQFAERYSRPFSSTIACWLIAFYHAHLENPKEEFLHISKVSQYLCSNTVMRSGDYAKARFWGLLESLGNVEENGDKDQKKKHSGKWKLTELGKMFVRGESSIHQRVVLFNNHCEGFEGEQIRIKDALDKEFNYNDLFSRRRKGN